jgi:SAM-dependent methyltransferase
MTIDTLTPPTLENWGPCGQPCAHPCDEPCEENAAAATGSRWSRWLESSLFNTLDVCFDDIYQEPKRILIVGGCRQLSLSQHLALLLPAAEIILVDPDEGITEKAKAEICCRFKFMASPLEQLPFESDSFDLTIAHNFLAYPQDWRRALSELGRVTSGNLFLSLHRPLLWKLASRVVGFTQGMHILGTENPPHLPESFDFLTHVHLYAKVKTKLAPFPWTTYMLEMRPMREERLTLAPA